MLASLDGDGTSYRVLLTEIRGPLARYFARRLGPALAANCEDLVQDALLAIHDKRQTFDRSQPFTTWLFAIARYKLIDHYRRQKLRVTLPLNDNAMPFAEDAEAAASARMDVETLLAGVPARQRGLIRSVRIEGASVAEAAAVAGMTETAARVSIHRALRTIASKLTGGRRDER